VQRNSGQTGTGLLTFACALDADMIAALRGSFVAMSVTLRAGSNFSSASSALQIRLSIGTGSTLGANAGAYTSQTDAIDTTLTITTSSVRYTATSSAIFPTATGQAVVQVTYTPAGTASTNDYFEIDDLQFELGTIPTTFDRRPFATEVRQCQRYYQKTFPYGTAPAQTGGNTGALAVYDQTGATGTFGTTFPFKATMRIAPTITTYNPGAGNANWRDTTNSADRTVTVDTASDGSVPLTGASGVAAATMRIHIAADAEIPT
jgi:hypothetical protein